MRAASPTDPDGAPIGKAGPSNPLAGLSTSAKGHARHHGSGPLPPLQVAAHDRMAITESSSDRPKTTFLQRLGSLRHRIKLGKLANVKVLGLEPSPELVAISMGAFKDSSECMYYQILLRDCIIIVPFFPTVYRFADIPNAYIIVF